MKIVVRKKVEYHLDEGDIHELADDELVMVLRAADNIIARGGRTMLAKILKGSKDKSILEYGLNNSPAYGFYHNKTIKEITHIIDYCIINGYLDIHYDGKLPKILYTDKGWNIEKHTYAKEWYYKLKQMIINDCIDLDVINNLLNVNREVVLLILDMIQTNKDVDLIVILLLWKEIEVKKVRKQIDEVIDKIKE